MTHNNTIEFEWWSPFWFDQLSDVSCPDGTHFGGFGKVHFQLSGLVHNNLPSIFIDFGLLRDHDILFIGLERFSDMIIFGCDEVLHDLCLN